MCERDVAPAVAGSLTSTPRPRRHAANGSQRRSTSRQTFNPKPRGQSRRRQYEVTVPRVRDRVAQTAAKLVLEPIFEASFLPSSFGFRPKRSAHQALERVRKTVNQGARWVVDLDFQDYYGS